MLRQGFQADIGGNAGPGHAQRSIDAPGRLEGHAGYVVEGLDAEAILDIDGCAVTGRRTVIPAVIRPHEIDARFMQIPERGP
jgi:hypothetical protein